MDTTNSNKGVFVRLSPISSLSVSVPLPPPAVSSSEVDDHLKRHPLRSYDLVSVEDFVTKGGVQPGNVAVCDWSSVNLSGGSGWSPNQRMKGVEKTGHEFDVDLEKPEPWRTFADKITGSGQMQTTTFEAEFPQSYPVERLKGVQARFTVVVKKIMKKVEKEGGGQTLDEYRGEIEGDILRRKVELVGEKVNWAIREEVMASHVVELDSRKATESVSWAKFGEKSKSQYEWQLVLETICKQKSEELGTKVEVS